MKKFLAALCICCLWATSGLAQYPEKPIEMIVAYSAGGGADVLGRTVGKYLETALGGSTSVVVKNVTGAGGLIGFTTTAAAKPDGYTIGVFNLPAAFALTQDRKADYDMNSFTYLANFVQDPNTVVVSAKSEYKTLAEFIAGAKAAPGAITVGLSSLGGNDHFSAIMMEEAAGVEFSLVPFKGASVVRTALIGGHVAAGTMALSQTTAFKDDIRVLAVLDDKRSAFRPDVPTAKELGYNVKMGSLRGVVGPAGLDPQITERLIKALIAVNENPDFQTMMAKQGNPIAFTSGKDYEAVAADQNSVANTIWKKTPWK